jgi:hypothetical protein
MCPFESTENLAIEANLQAVASRLARSAPRDRDFKQQSCPYDGVNAADNSCSASAFA